VLAYGQIYLLLRFEVLSIVKVLVRRNSLLLQLHLPLFKNNHHLLVKKTSFTLQLHLRLSLFY